MDRSVRLTVGQECVLRFDETIFIHLVPMDENRDSEIIRGDSDGSVVGVYSFSQNSLAEPHHVLQVVEVCIIIEEVVVEVVGDFLLQIRVLGYLPVEADAE